VTRLEEQKVSKKSVDEVSLYEFRKMIRKEAHAEDIEIVNNPAMVFGTIILVVGHAILNACGASSFRLSDDDFRYAAELAFMNSFLAASSSGIVAFILKRHAT
jgi:ammonia channel protein AmtB